MALCFFDIEQRIQDTSKTGNQRALQDGEHNTSPRGPHRDKETWARKVRARLSCKELMYHFISKPGIND